VPCPVSLIAPYHQNQGRGGAGSRAVGPAVPGRIPARSGPWSVSAVQDQDDEQHADDDGHDEREADGRR
jgi:hypothetical protein